MLFHLLQSELTPVFKVPGIFPFFRSSGITLCSFLCLQNRFNAEIEALQRSIEQRERAAKELHARIHELENTESNLNHSYSTLSLKVKIDHII